MSSNEKETEILNAICEYLVYRGHFFWRQNTAPIYKDGRYIRLPKFALKGVPDVILIFQGNFVGLECKTSKGRQSEDQLQFEARCKEAGGRYHIVRSIEDVQSLGL